MKGRRSYAKITYEGKDITGEITSYLKNISFTDNLDKGDSASFSLIGDEWISKWPILKGDKFSLELFTSNWLNKGDNRSLNCGTFTVDDISFDGAPDTLKVSGTSIDITKGIKEVKRDNNWENVSLEEIAKEIANKYSMSLIYKDDNKILFDRIDQVKESDSHLLYRLSKEQGLKMKITGSLLIFFDEEKYENLESIVTLKKSTLDRYSIQCDDSNVYDCCEITYYDPFLGEQLKGSFKSPTSEFYRIKTGKFLYKDIDTGVVGKTKEEKEEHLKIRAKKLLREKNKNETRATIVTMGDVNYQAGSNITLEEFGIYSGVYLIDSVVHKLDSGYRCSIAGRRKLNF